MKLFSGIAKLGTFALLFLSVAPGSRCFAQPVPDQTLQEANSLSTAFERVAATITPSVVTISAVKKIKGQKFSRQMQDPFFEHFRQFFGDDLFNQLIPRNPEGFAQQGLGTGVIVDNKGHILTNNHVVGEADEVSVRLHSGKSVDATVIGTDPKTDLAVIRIKSGSSDLAPAKLGDSDRLRIGEWVVACGNPFGLDNSITAGIVSAKGRSFMGDGQYEDFIQTDAAINPGNSGGPLVNLHGEVVGINSAIFTRTGGYMGIGFAIPINLARTVMESLISSGKVVRGWLGVGIQNLTEDLAESFGFNGTEGALIGHVEQGGPADKAGIKQGDIMIALNGEKIKNTNQLRNLVASLAPGKTVEAQVIRNGDAKTISIKIGELQARNQDGAPEREGEEASSAGSLGLVLENITPDLAQRLGLKTRKGVIVRSVVPGGAAQKAGLQSKDVIVSINGKRVESLGDFNEVLKESNLKKGLRLVVQSEGMEHYVFLKSDE